MRRRGQYALSNFPLSKPRFRLFATLDYSSGFFEFQTNRQFCSKKWMSADPSIEEWMVPSQTTILEYINPANELGKVPHSDASGANTAISKARESTNISVEVSASKLQKVHNDISLESRRALQRIGVDQKQLELNSNSLVQVSPVIFVVFSPITASEILLVPSRAGIPAFQSFTDMCAEAVANRYERPHSWIFKKGPGNLYLYILERVAVYKYSDYVPERLKFWTAFLKSL